MYTTRCPSCGREYSDNENRVSIGTTGICLRCRAERVNDEERWETEGGRYLT